MDTDVEQARIPPESHAAQSVLFPLSNFSRPPVSPRELCARIGLNWLAAKRLHDGGWLSFDPESVMALNPAQEAELCFLGRLVVAGCDEPLLRHMLAGLRKPYAYRLDRIYYDWESPRWELLPTVDDARKGFEAWLKDLAESGELPTLESLRFALDSSIRHLRRHSSW